MCITIYQIIPSVPQQKIVKIKNGGTGPLRVEHKTNGDGHMSRKNLAWRSLEEALGEEET